MHLTLGLEEAAHGGTRQISLADATGRVSKLDVRVPQGVRPGQRIRLAGRGAPGLGGGEPGDLYMVVELAPHPRFKLKGKDLQTTLSVTPWEAALGADVELATLDGDVTLKVPPGSSSGRRIRLKGRGFPSRKGARGDLYAEVRVAVPSKVTDEERELFERLAEISAFSPRED